MISNPKLLKLGVIGTVIAALCCFTPILFILLGIVGLGALTGYMDYVLIPALVGFVGITVYALYQRRRAQACGSTDHAGPKQ